jgi:hypothetical protein
MNRWQRLLPATEAGLIYTTEPVFASLFALFMPLWLSALLPIHYSNEQATENLLLGGGLITAANVLIQLQNRRGRGGLPASPLVPPQPASLCSFPPDEL